MNEFWDDADLIYSYTRKQAIEDGILIDISSIARAYGIKFPTACTCGVEAALINPIEDLKQNAAIMDRMMFGIIKAMQAQEKEGDTLYFKAVNYKMEEVDLWAKCGPGDDTEPVITIMLVGED